MPSDDSPATAWGEPEGQTKQLSDDILSRFDEVQGSDISAVNDQNDLHLDEAWLEKVGTCDIDDR